MLLPSILAHSMWYLLFPIFINLANDLLLRLLLPWHYFYDLLKNAQGGVWCTVCAAPKSMVFEPFRFETKHRF